MSIGILIISPTFTLISELIIVHKEAFPTPSWLSTTLILPIVDSTNPNETPVVGSIISSPLPLRVKIKPFWTPEAKPVLIITFVGSITLVTTASHGILLETFSIFLMILLHTWFALFEITLFVKPSFTDFVILLLALAFSAKIISPVFTSIILMSIPMRASLLVFSIFNWLSVTLLATSDEKPSPVTELTSNSVIVPNIPNWTPSILPMLTADWSDIKPDCWNPCSLISDAICCRSITVKSFDLTSSVVRVSNIMLSKLLNCLLSTSSIIENIATLVFLLRLE